MDTTRLEPYIDIEQAKHHIDDISFRLHAYHRTSGDNSREFEYYRRHDLNLARLAFTDLFYHLDPELEIVINIGENEVDGTTFRRDPYDFIYQTNEPIDAGTIVDIERIEEFCAYGTNKSSFFVGNYTVMLGLPVIGEIIHNRGEIMLTKSRQPTESSTLSV